MQLHPLWPIVFVFLAACWPTWEGWHTAQDHDSDGYKSEQAGGEDCDDTNKTINPDAVEICDGLDNDCDGAIDDADDNVTGLLLWHLDADNDGFVTPTRGSPSKHASNQKGTWPMPLTAMMGRQRSTPEPPISATG